MTIKKLASAVTASALLMTTSQVLADADIAVQPAGTPLPAMTATTHVDLCVVVPQILIFGVGATGDNIAKLQWTIDNAAAVAVGNDQTYSGAAAPFTAPAPFSATATASVVSNGGTGATAAGNQADLPVFLFSNSGTDVTITTSVDGGPAGTGTVDALDQSGGGNSIPISSFTGGDGGSITHPALATASTAATAPDANGIVNLSDVWTYSYTPASIPAAGTYEARVTYVASTP